MAGNATHLDRPQAPPAIAAAAVVILVLALSAAEPVRGAVANLAGKVIVFLATPFAPDIRGFEDLPQQSRVIARDGTELGVVGEQRRDDVPLERISEHARNAVLAAEDADFYNHPGVDAQAVARALVHTMVGRVEGGSTITQQLAKLNYVGSRRTFLRKFSEVLYTARLEQRYTKDQLFERYLNQAYFGQHVFGIGAAARTFFGVEPDALTPAQAATLAGKIHAPERLDPWTRPGAMQKRRDAVLDAMREHGWLSASVHADARKTPVTVVGKQPPPARGGRAPHFLDLVVREASGVEALGASPEARREQVLHTGGYRIETTLDPRSQDAATAAVAAVLGAPGDPTTAVVSVEPGNGAIRTYVAGLDANRQFDVASQGRRQPGSSFKPIAYLAMLAKGTDPRSLFDSSSPRTIRCADEDWPVHNYAGEGAGGKITVDDALVRSVNVVFGQIAELTGPEAIRDAAIAAGVDKDAVTPPRCAMALGGLREGVSPLEEAAAYSTFAAGGQYAQPYAITKVLDRRGRTVFERRPEIVQSFDRRHAGVLNAALIDAVRKGTGRAAAIGRPVAGKTGTTDDWVNAWFAGFVPQLATAVWVGHPEGSVPMTDVHGIRVAGGTYPARIFGRYMRDALQGVPVRPIFTASPDELGFAILNTPSPPPMRFIIITPEPLAPAFAADAPAEQRTYAEERGPGPTFQPGKKRQPSPPPPCSPSPSPEPSGSPTPSPSPTPSSSPTPSPTPCA